MSTIASLLEREIPGVTVDPAGLPCWELGVDGFGVIELRSSFEHATGSAIPDPFWTQLETPSQLLDYAGELPREDSEKSPEPSLLRHAALDMPQVVLGGQSESWLFKEPGDAHGSMITGGLDAPSSAPLEGQPTIPAGWPIPEVATRPELGQGHRQRRAAALPSPLFETSYEIIPYHDINGVGLLYFAAYPITSDTCELKYMGRAHGWALQASTVARDDFYSAHSDAHDRIVYRVHARHDTPAGLDIESSLSRASDGALMAYLVTRKVLAGG